MKKSIVIFILAMLIASGAAYCQHTVVEVIDTPSANSMELGAYAVSVRLYNQGSILTRLYYGIIMRNLTLGLSFDAENVVGTGDIQPRRPYLYIKIPLYTGDQKWPAIGLGFDEQGLGAYNEDTDEYAVPPTGFFMVFTKNGLLTGLDMSMGANAYYSFIEDAEKKIYGFASANFMIGPEFMIMGEVKEITSWDSYANAGFKYFLNPELSFEFSCLDLGGRIMTERIIRIIYTGEF